MEDARRKTSQSGKAGVWDWLRDKYYQLVLITLALTGLICLAVSFALLDQNLRNMFQNLGLSFFPLGAVAFFLSTYVDHIAKKEISAEIDRCIRGCTTLCASCRRYGIEEVCLTRGDVWVKFGPILKKEITEGGRVWIVCTSMKGILDVATGEFSGRFAMGEIAGAQDKCDVKVLMIDPQFAHLREQGESQEQIESHIRESLSDLKKFGLARERVKFHQGTPTVFAIATSEYMLLNPYPYDGRACESFCLVVRKVSDGTQDIYAQYLKSHFRSPWKRAVEVPEKMWRDLGNKSGAASPPQT